MLAHSSDDVGAQLRPAVLAADFTASFQSHQILRAEDRCLLSVSRQGAAEGGRHGKYGWLNFAQAGAWDRRCPLCWSPAPICSGPSVRARAEQGICPPHADNTTLEMLSLRGWRIFRNQVRFARLGLFRGGRGLVYRDTGCKLHNTDWNLLIEDLNRWKIQKCVNK